MDKVQDPEEKKNLTKIEHILPKMLVLVPQKDPPAFFITEHSTEKFN